MDAKVSSLVLVEQLNLKGWVAQTTRATEHCAPLPVGPERIYDARESVRMKFDYQVLLCLPDLFEYCPRFRSDVMSFYKCMLQHIHVEPGQGDRHYLQLLAGKPVRLAVMDRSADNPPDDRFALAGVDDAEPKAKAKQRGRGGVRARRPVPGSATGTTRRGALAGIGCACAGWRRIRNATLAGRRSHQATAALGPVTRLRGPM